MFTTRTIKKSDTDTNRERDEERERERERERGWRESTSQGANGSYNACPATSAMTNACQAKKTERGGDERGAKEREGGGF